MALARADQYREFQPATAPLLATLFASIRHDDPVHLRAYMLLARLSCPQYAERKETRQVADSLYTDLCENQADTWVWFEQQVRYDAAVLPTALLRAGACLNDDRFIDAGMRSFDWLHTICTTDNSYRFPGHLGLLRGADLRGSGDEQPLEARAFVDASVDAYQLTGDDIYRQRAFDAFSWFQGRNRLGIIMAGDDGGCFDGLGQYDANKNSGAESTLAFITASMSIRSLLATDTSSSATVVNLGT